MGVESDSRGSRNCELDSGSSGSVKQGPAQIYGRFALLAAPIVQGYIYLNLETGSPYGSSSITQRGYIARYNKCVRIRYILERAHGFLT